MFGKNCYGCNQTLDLHLIYLNNDTYLSHLNKDYDPGEFVLEVEPNTGIMTRTKTESTIVFTFDCYKSEPSRCKYMLPFPAFDELKGKSFPVFELTEEIVIDQAKLNATAGMQAVFENRDHMVICGAILTAVGFGAFILASLFSFIHYMNDPLKIDREEDVANKERLNKISQHQKFEMDFEELEIKGFVVS